MSNSFKVKEFSFVLTLVIIFIFYNQYNSPKHSPQPEQVKSKKIDEELIKAINLLKDQVFFLNEEIKETIDVIYGLYLKFNFRSGELRKKFESLK